MKLVGYLKGSYINISNFGCTLAEWAVLYMTKVYYRRKAENCDAEDSPGFFAEFCSLLLALLDKERDKDLKALTCLGRKPCLHLWEWGQLFPIQRSFLERAVPPFHVALTAMEILPFIILHLIEFTWVSSTIPYLVFNKKTSKAPLGEVAQ